MITRFANLTSRLALTLVFILGFTACGGGGGGSDGGGFLGGGNGGGADVDPLTIELVLTDGDGNTTDSVTSTSPATLTVTLLNSSDVDSVAGSVVTATSDIGLIVPSSGTALTDENGVAVFQVQAGTILGAGTIEVSAEGELGPVVESLNMQVGRPSLRLGYFAGDTFVDGELGVTADTLPAGGTTLVTLAVVDDAGQKVESTVEVGLSSECAQNGLAELPSSVNTINGTASVTYSATGCEGLDTLTALLVEASGQATGTVSIATPKLGSIRFISATPESIALKGTGGAGRQETSQVVFGVVSELGAAISGATVEFSLSTEIGGISLVNSSALSDADGFAKTTVVAGDVSSPVRVIATIQVIDGSGNSVTLSTVSDLLIVSSGLPDQNSISLSAASVNVGGSWNVDGLTTLVTVRMADKFNNPVPDGTSALFSTEYGSIGDSCTTVGGACSVTWISQQPRRSVFNDELRRTIAPTTSPTTVTPCSSPLVNGFGPCPADLGSSRGGRSTITVTALGEEFFVDANGNGRYDEDELFDNLTEAFFDYNEDRSYTPFSNPSDLSGEEELFVDYNQNGVYDLNDQPTWYNGILCPLEGSGIFCSRDLVNVRDNLVLVMSAEAMSIILVNSSGNQVSGTQEGSSYTLYIADINNNPPAGDADITVSPSGDCEFVFDPVTTPPNTSTPGAFAIGVQTKESGFFSVTTVNGGATSSATFTCTGAAPPVDPNAPLDCGFSPPPAGCT